MTIYMENLMYFLMGRFDVWTNIEEMTATQRLVMANKKLDLDELRPV